MELATAERPIGAHLWTTFMTGGDGRGMRVSYERRRVSERQRGSCPSTIESDRAKRCGCCTRRVWSSTLTGPSCVARNVMHLLRIFRQTNFTRAAARGTATGRAAAGVDRTTQKTEEAQRYEHTPLHTRPAVRRDGDRNARMHLDRLPSPGAVPAAGRASRLSGGAAYSHTVSRAHVPIRRPISPQHAIMIATLFLLLQRRHTHARPHPRPMAIPRSQNLAHGLLSSSSSSSVSSSLPARLSSCAPSSPSRRSGTRSSHHPGQTGSRTAAPRPARGRAPRRR